MSGGGIVFSYEKIILISLILISAFAINEDIESEIAILQEKNSKLELEATRQKSRIDDINKKIEDIKTYLEKNKGDLNLLMIANVIQSSVTAMITVILCETQLKKFLDLMKLKFRLNEVEGEKCK